MKRTRTPQMFYNLYGRMPSESEMEQFDKNYINDIALQMSGKEMREYSKKMVTNRK